MSKALVVENVHGDAPLRLAVAAKLAFPDGSMTVSGLRREAARGRLRMERIAGKDFTTLNCIQKMRELCRVEQKVQDSGYDQHGATQAASSLPARPGLFSTVESTSPQDALRTKLQRRKQGLHTI